MPLGQPPARAFGTCCNVLASLGRREQEVGNANCQPTPTTPRNAMRARPSRAGQWGRWRPSKEDAQRFLGLRVGIGRRCTCANDWSCRIRPFPARCPATVRFGRHTPASRHGYVGLLLMQLSAGQIRRSWPGKELGRDDAALARLGAGPNGR